MTGSDPAMAAFLPMSPLGPPPLKIVLLAILLQARLNARLRELRVTRSTSHQQDHRKDGDGDGGVSRDGPR